MSLRFYKNEEIPRFGNGIALRPGASRYPHLWDKYVGGFLNPAPRTFDPGPGRYDGTALDTYVYSPYGMAYYGQGTTNNILWAGISPAFSKWKVDPPLTWVCNFGIADNWSSGTQYLYATSASKTVMAASKYSGWFVTWDVTNGIAQWYWGNNVVTTLLTCGWVTQDGAGWYMPGTLSTIGWVTLGITVATAPPYADGAAAEAAVNFWFDGFHDYGGKDNGNPTLSILQTAASPTYFNRMASTGCYVVSPVMHLWSRVLSDSEMSLVTSDPLAMFRPTHWERRTRWGMVPSTGRYVSIGGPTIKSSRVILAG